MIEAADHRRINLTINGRIVTHDVAVRMLLSDFLRHELKLTGTHVGCEHGVCGACTVLLHGRSVRSCLMLAVQAEGADITTVEGLAAPDGTLHPLQEAFRNNHGLQCGFCTPGMLMTLTELLQETKRPSEAEIKLAISGNICRCTGYGSIIAAAQEAAEHLDGVDR